MNILKSPQINTPLPTWLNTSISMSENMTYWCHLCSQNSLNTPVFGSLWLKFQCFDITANVSPYDLLKHARVLLFVYCCVCCQKIYCIQCVKKTYCLT